MFDYKEFYTIKGEVFDDKKEFINVMDKIICSKKIILKEIRNKKKENLTKNQSSILPGFKESHK